MRKKVVYKARSIRGESIGETLIALLISALALLMLAGAIGSASGIVTRNKAAMKEYYVGENGNASQQSDAFNKWKGKMSTDLR